MVDEERVEEEKAVDEYEEEEEKYKYTCPVCKAKIPFFLARKQARYARCPACGAIFARKEIEGKFGKYAIKIVPMNVYKQAGKIPLDKLLKIIEGGEEESETKVEETKHETTSIEEELKEKIDKELLSHREEPSKTIRASEVFERPRDPCDVLQEILDTYDFLKDDFKKLMVRRCEIFGSLHPLELYHFLKTMRSGVKTEQEAAFIAEEYAVALKREEEKARKMGYPYVLPNMSSTPPLSARDTIYVQRIMEIMKPSPQPQQPSQPPSFVRYTTSQTTSPATTSQFQQQQQQPSTQSSVDNIISKIKERLGLHDRTQYYQAPHQPNVTIDVGSIVSAVVEANKPTQEVLVKLIDKMSEKQSQPQQDNLTTQLLAQLMNMQKAMAEVQVKSVADAIKEAMKYVADKIAEAQKSNAQILQLVMEMVKSKPQPTPPPELIKEVAESKAKLEFTKELLKIQQEQYKRSLEVALRELEKRDKQLRELQELITRMSAMQTTPGEYKSDEAKILAQAINNLSMTARDTFKPLLENLARREPVKLIVESLPKIMMYSSPSMPIPQYQQPSEKPKKTKTSEEIIEELEKEGLVEE